MLMLTDAELQDILWRIDNDMDNWRDRVRLRQHITEQAATIAQLKAQRPMRCGEVDAVAGGSAG